MIYMGGMLQGCRIQWVCSIMDTVVWISVVKIDGDGGGHKGSGETAEQWGQWNVVFKK